MVTHSFVIYSQLEMRALYIHLSIHPVLRTFPFLLFAPLLPGIPLSTFLYLAIPPWYIELIPASVILVSVQKEGQEGINESGVSDVGCKNCAKIMI